MLNCIFQHHHEQSAYLFIDLLVELCDLTQRTRDRIVSEVGEIEQSRNLEVADDFTNLRALLQINFKLRIRFVASIFFDIEPNLPRKALFLQFSLSESFGGNMLPFFDLLKELVIPDGTSLR